MINNHIEYAVVLTILSTRPSSLDEIWDNDRIYEVLSQASYDGLGDRAWELAEFTINQPAQANILLHEAHLRDPDIRQQAIDYMVACWRNGYVDTPEETFVLRGITYTNRDTSGFKEHATFCRELLSDLDAATACGITFYCDHTVPNELWYEHPWVNIKPVDADKAETVIEEAERRLKSAGLEPEETFGYCSGARRTAPKL